MISGVSIESASYIENNTETDILKLIQSKILLMRKKNLHHNFSQMRSAKLAIVKEVIIEEQDNHNFSR